MTEEASAVATESSTEQVAQTETPQTFIDANGKFTPGWKEHYVPEEMRADKVYDTFSDVGGSLKMLGSLQGMIGKKGVIIPGEASPEHEWDNFHRELGRPDTKDMYEMKVADDISGFYDENLVAEAREAFFKMGFDQKKVDTLWAFEEKRIRAFAEAETKAQVEKDNAFAEWSAANPEKFQRANRIINENATDDEHKKALIEKYDNDIVFAELLASVGSKFMEHRIITDTETPHGMTPGEALTKAKQIEATPGFLMPDDKGQLMKDVNRTEYERLEKERDKFYKLANVGSA